MSEVTEHPGRHGGDRFASARLIADTVLYEGYVLYPYRASSQKNRMRWQFGVLVPPDHAVSAPSERASMRTEVVVIGAPAAGGTAEAGTAVTSTGRAGSHGRLTVRVRCLQVQQRDVEEAAENGTFVPVPTLVVGAHTMVSWDEAVEHEIDVPAVALEPAASVTHPFVLDDGDDVELLHDAGGAVVGRTVRRRARVQGEVRISAGAVGDDASLLALRVDVLNVTAWPAGAGAPREEAMRHSLVAVHTLLAVDGASLASLLDPPEHAERAVAACSSIGTYAVLIGGEHTSDVMLSSPIILYDSPAVAPESVADFCDATEIDEILALRVMTLTDAEKAEARGTDPRAAAIVDRCDTMPDELWARLHGAVRSLAPRAEPWALADDMIDTGTVVGGPSGAGTGGDPAFGPGIQMWSPDGTQIDTPEVPWWDPGTDAAFDPFTDTMLIGGVAIGQGTRVRLHPARRADAQDLFYGGRIATVKGVFNDVDGDRHVAVLIDDDEASETFDWQGRYLFFHPDEIEVVSCPGP